VNQKKIPQAIHDAPITLMPPGVGLTIPPCPGNRFRLSSFQMVLSSQQIPAAASLLNTIKLRPSARNTIAGIFECIRMTLNDDYTTNRSLNRPWFILSLLLRTPLPETTGLPTAGHEGVRFGRPTRPVWASTINSPCP